MPVNKPAPRRSSKSDLVRVDAHRIKPSEYKELPELTNEMLAEAAVKKGPSTLIQSTSTHFTAPAC